MSKLSTKLYTIITSPINTLDTTELIFLDSSGDSFSPNYMKFSVSSAIATPAGGFLIEFRTSGVTPGIVIASAMAPTHAWIGTYVESRQHGIQEFDFSDNQRPTGISIRNGTGSSLVRLVVMYGQKSIENPLRSSSRGKGN